MSENMADWAILTVTRGGTVSLLKGLTEREADEIKEKLDPWQGQTSGFRTVQDSDMRTIHKFRSSDSEQFTHKGN